MDDDGKKYLYHVIVANGGNRIFVAEMKSDLSRIIPQTLTKCIEAEKPWENIENSEWSVTEGPTVIKQGRLYYMIYSANDFRSINYGVGYAVSKSPLGPWKRYEGNPVLSKKQTAKNGSGHGDLFKGQKNNWFYVFHIHNSENKMGPRKTALVKAGFNSEKEFIIDAASSYELQISRELP